MTWRLVRGVVYMQRWSLMYMAFMVGLLSGQRRWMGVVALLTALLAGLKARDAVAMRELVPLPVGPSELHRAEWLLAALVPSALLTFGHGVNGTWHTPRVGFEVVYFSLFSAWLVRADEDPLLPRVLVGITFLVAPFVVIDRLPPATTDVPAFLWLCAASLLGVGLRPLISPPSVYPRPSRTVAFEPPPLPARLRPPTTPDFASRFEGMWVPMGGVTGQAAHWTLVVVVLLAVAQYFKGDVALWWAFARSITDSRFLTSVGLPTMFMIGLGPSLAPWLGVLRRLPMSTRRLALLLSLAPGTMPVVFWTSLFALQFLSTAEAPDALRLGLLSVFIGVVALIDALGTRLGSTMTKAVLGLLVFLPTSYGLAKQMPLVEAVLAHWALPLAGVLCVALAWFVNFNTLTRSAGSSRAYQAERSTQSAGAR
jgi:hypothetical protein